MTIRRPDPIGMALIGILILAAMAAYCPAYQPFATSGSGAGMRNRGLGFVACSYPNDGSASASIDATGIVLDLLSVAPAYATTENPASSVAFAHDIWVANVGSNSLSVSLGAPTTASMGSSYAVTGVEEVNLDMIPVPAGHVLEIEAPGRFLAITSSSGTDAIVGWLR